MAQVIGDLRPDATYGERRVLEALAGMPDEYVVWPELPINHGYLAYPDFVVLHPRFGVIVLEVKDWVEIASANPRTWVIRTRDGREHGEPNPVLGARDKALMIADRLKKEPRLIHQRGTRRGNLMVPWAYGAVFPNLTRTLLFRLGDIVEPKYLICKDEIDSCRIAECLGGLGPFQVDLTPEQIDAARRTLYPEIVIPRRAGDDSPPTLDQTQEQVAKESLWEQLTLEGERVAHSFPVRLVRGVAGSGKTLVLSARARYLAQVHPEWRILVVTFNEPLARHLAGHFEDFQGQIRAVNFHRLCKEWLEQHGLWQSPFTDTAQLDWIARTLATKMPHADRFDPDFLREEFNWMKDTGVLERARYLSEPRIGRGKRLAESERALVYDVFAHYGRHLQVYRRFDWADVPYLVLGLLDDGFLPPSQFDAILVDEAQDFAPIWFEVLKRVLNPATGVMFMAADATQRIYRKFTWKSLGLDVVGHTRILPRSYRSTYEIMQTAFELLGDSRPLRQQLEQEGEALLQPQIDPNWMRRGPYPELRQCQDRRAEVHFLVRTIKDLLANGYRPGDIAVLHRKHYGPGDYLPLLKEAGIPAALLKETGDTTDNVVALGTMHMAKGLEYRAVFILQLQTLFSLDKLMQQEEKESFLADELRLLYVGITRARERVYLSYQSRLPKEIAHLKAFLEAVKAI